MFVQGKIDATLEVEIDNDSKESRRRLCVVAFELKTGRRQRESHCAQSMLYAAMLNERHTALNLAKRANAASSLSQQQQQHQQQPPQPAWLYADALPNGGVAMLHYLSEEAARVTTYSEPATQVRLFDKNRTQNKN